MMRWVCAAIAVLCLRAMAQECAIGGALVDSSSGKPVVHARVIGEVAGKYSVVHLSDEQGRFCFANLAPESYRLIAQKAGYLEAEHGVMLAVETEGTIQPVTLRMTRYAILSGTVLDSTGALVPNAAVRVWTRERSNNQWIPSVETDTTADSRGAFRIAGLAPGTYYVSVRPPSDGLNRYAIPFVDAAGQVVREKEFQTFHTGSFTFAGATPIELTAGEEVGRLVLSLRKGQLRRVSGRVENPAGGYLTYETVQDTNSESLGAIPLSSDGSFVQFGLAPEKYLLRLFDGRKVRSQKEVDLTAGDASGVSLDAIEETDVPVTFRLDGKGPAFRPIIPGSAPTLLTREGSDDAIALRQAEDGKYRFENVQPGFYHLQMGFGGQQFYVKSVGYGGETQTGNKVDLRTFRAEGLEVTLSPNVAEVRGKVAGRDGDTGDDVTVLLVDQDGIASETGIDQKGRFQMSTVAPGKYRLFAIAGFDQGEWDGAALEKALAGKFVELEVKESEKKQVSVTAISAVEWQAALKKVRG